MGILKEKYTREYFTGKKEDGTPAGYGVEGFDAFFEGSIRTIDSSILSRMNFNNKKVLEFGFGRGETIKYALEHGAQYYEGIDFAEPAIEIATEFLKKHNLSTPILHCADALTFLKSGELKEKFDIIIMFDFVEHIPRYELREILTLLHDVLNERAIIAVNTPVYRADNDVITEGLKSINELNMIDTSNLIPQTAGMHCNLYTISSLQRFMESSGFVSCSEAHFFISHNNLTTDISQKSYSDRWKYLQKAGYSLLGDYEEDVLEYAYNRVNIPTLRTFSKGDMSGISLLMTDDYANLYHDGFHDRELIMHMQTQDCNDAIIYDVGGFIGMSSLVFAKTIPTAKQILCFEPNPWNQHRILVNLSNNEKYAEKIQMYRFALGSANDEEDMLLSDSIDNGYSSTSQLMDGDGTNNTHEALLGLEFHKMSVQVRKLDSFVEETGLVPDIIKLDIEGAEALFLEGAEQTIRKYKPQLYIEFHSIPATLHSMRLLNEVGYKVTVLKQEPDKRILAFAAYSTEIATEQPVDSRWIQYEFESLRLIRQKDADTIAKYELKNVALKHLLADTQSAFTRIQTVLASTQSALASTQSELTGTQLELASTQSELTGTQLELASTQSELASTQTELANTQTELARTQTELTIAQTELVNTQLELAITQSQFASVKTQLESTITELSNTQEYLNSVFNSRSWRIMKPIRALKRMFTK